MAQQLVTGEPPSNYLLGGAQRLAWTGRPGPNSPGNQRGMPIAEPKPRRFEGDMKVRTAIRAGFDGVKGESQDNKHKGNIEL